MICSWLTLSHFLLLVYEENNILLLETDSYQYVSLP